MAANSYAIVERMSLGSHRGVTVDVTFTSPAVGGEDFFASNCGLNLISVLTCEPTYVNAGGHEFGVSWDKTLNKLTCTDAGIEASPASQVVRILVIGK